MALIQLDKVSVSFGAARILDRVSWGLIPERRVGLIGVNGCGKTTLLRVLADALAPDSGTVERAKGLRLGFMEQEPALAKDDNMHDAVLSACAEVLDMERRMRCIEHEIADAAEDKRSVLLARLGRLQERFEHHGGYDCETRVAAVLMGLGFNEDEFNRPVSVLSGGERSRVALARLLLLEPDVLFLDEPTNHLDLAGIEWFEGFLTRKFRGAAVIVSHDRTFLERTVTHILELERGALTEYRGGYDQYAEVKALRDADRQRRYEEQQAFIRKEEAFIRKYHAGQRGREAQGRQKRLNRLDRLDAAHQSKKMAVRFNAGIEPGAVCIRAEGVAKGYNQQVFFQNLDLEIQRGDRVGIIGPNGSGKTTLLRVLLGLDSPDAGVVTQGHHVRIGYLAQHAEGLSSDRTVLDEVWERRRTQTEEAVRNVLGRFLFSGDDDINKRMRDLSGGERTRVALACLLVEEPNVLVMDEPTNHLDIPSCLALERALRDYEGTVLVVSHDRTFLNNVASTLIVLDGESGQRFHGTYADYAERKAAMESAPAATEPSKPRPAPSKKKKPRLSKNRLAQLEADIAELESEKQSLETQLADLALYSDTDKARAVPHRYQDVCGQLDALYAQWAEHES